MTSLNEKEKCVLYRIDQELASKKQSNFPEFPELSKMDIIQAIKKLEKLGYIEIDKDLDTWTSTEKGQEYISKNKKDFNEISNKFQKNLFSK